MLSEDLDLYIRLRRALGFKLASQHSMLKSFVAFAEGSGDQHVRVKRALDWALQASSPSQQRIRLLTIRRFALAMRAEDSRHEIPARDALGRARFERRAPHIYTKEEIGQLVDAASQLGPPDTIRPLTYSTLFALLAATGLRISEALAMQLDDATADGLIVQQSKFRKSRMLPLHNTVWEALNAYLSVRNEYGYSDKHLFIANTGKFPAYRTVITVFLQLSRSLGLRDEAGGQGPRIHDLRHTFAVRSLEQCAPDRNAIVRHISALSTYLGHAHVTDTYWYLHATPLLMGQLADAGEALFRGDAS
jgi:integrase